MSAETTNISIFGIYHLKIGGKVDFHLGEFFWVFIGGGGGHN